MTDTTIALVTGANKGLGFETARRLLRPLGRCRRRADHIRCRPARRPGQQRRDHRVTHRSAGDGPEDFLACYDVNLLGPVRVTRAFLPLLRQAELPRIVMVSSGMGSLTVTTDPDRRESGFVGLVYPSSKSALNMVTTMYAKALPGASPSGRSRLVRRGRIHRTDAPVQWGRAAAIVVVAGGHRNPVAQGSFVRARREALRPAPAFGYQRSPDTTECRTSVRGMETVIVGANGSETAAKAVERAGKVAASMGARLVVVTAYGTDDVGEVGVGSDTYVVSTAQEATAFAEQTAARLGTEYGILARGMAASGNPERVILDAAKRLDASVILVGNVRMQGPGRLLGSVANHIAHHAPCDVYIVKTA